MACCLEFRRPLGFALALVIVVFLAWRKASPIDLTVNRSAWNVLILTLDTTRADRLGAYGFAGADTPNIDRLAREGALFEQAESAAPLTLPAHSSLFTGRFPFQHGVRDNGEVLDPAERTLAQVLQERGFRTAAFAASYVLDASGAWRAGSSVRRALDPRRRPTRDLRRSADSCRSCRWLDTMSDSRFSAGSTSTRTATPTCRTSGPTATGYQAPLPSWIANRRSSRLDARHLPIAHSIVVAITERVSANMANGRTDCLCTRA